MARDPRSPEDLNIDENAPTMAPDSTAPGKRAALDATPPATPPTFDTSPTELPPPLRSGPDSLPPPPVLELAPTELPLSDATPPVGVHAAHEVLPVVDPVHYNVLEEHARGGMGRVLRALDRRLRRPVAVKELLWHSPVVPPELTARFVREALLTARLQHPSIVPVHEAGRWPDGRPFYAMKLVTGRSLAEVIHERRHNLDERLALLPNLIAVAEAIAYAHSEHIIHRDLKPANVLVGSFGETVVVDWGLAKVVDSVENHGNEKLSSVSLPGSSDDGRTEVGAIVGTPSYMPPEQAQGLPVDERADVYALGAMLYATLAGEPPYPRATPQQVLAGPPVPLRKKQPGVPEELATIVVKAMARAPGDRYATARELADDLQRFQTGRLVAAHRYSRAALVRRWLRRNRVPVAISTIALSLLAATGAMSVRRVVEEKTVALAERARAEAAREREAARVDELTLSQARAALDHDPTSSVAWLKRLRPGPRISAARVVAIEAQERGVAARVLVGSGDAITAIAWAPDGNALVTAARDHSVHRWSLASGAVETLAGPTADIAALAWSPDGSTLVAASADGVWRWRDRDREGFRLDAAAALDIAIRADGKRVSAAGTDGTLRSWELPSSSALPPIALGSISKIAFAADTGVLVARTGAGIVRIDSSTGNPIGEPIGAGVFAGAGSLALSRDGHRVAAGSDGVASVWSLSDGALVASLPMGPRPLVALSPDGGTLLAGSEDGLDRALDLASGHRTELSHAGEATRSVTISNDGARWSATRGINVRLWEAATVELRKLRGHTLDAVHVAFSPDGQRLATAGLDGATRIFITTAGAPWPLRLADRSLKATSVALSPDGARIALVIGGARAGEVGLVDPARGGVRWLAMGAPAGVTVRRVAFAPDGRLAAACSDGTVRVSDAGAIAMTTLAPVHAGVAEDLAFAPDGTLASVGSDGTVIRWPPTLSSGLTFTAGARLARVRFVPDGRLVTASADGDVALWSATDHAPLFRRQLAGPPADLDVAPDASVIAASAVGERHVHLWGATDGKLIDEIAEDDPVASLRFLDGGAVLAVAGRDGALTLRDLPTGETIALAGHHPGIVSLARAQSSLVTLGDDGGVRLWPTPVPDGAAPLSAWLAAASDAEIDEHDHLRGAKP